MQFTAIKLKYIKQPHLPQYLSEVIRLTVSRGAAPAVPGTVICPCRGVF